MPMESIWSDIDYLQDFRNFMVDPEYGDLDTFKKVVLKDKKWVPVITGSIPQ